MDITSFVVGLEAGKASGGGMKGFHKVQFFNDDRTTLLYTVFVPTGASAMYAGETPVSTVDGGYIFEGFEPAPEHITSDFDCYAAYAQFTSLDDATWEEIAEKSADGTAQNFFAVGDTKMIHIEGTVGTLAVNGDYGVFIIGFDHNEELEGKGIHFGTFKSAVSNGIDLALVDGKYDVSSENGSKCFNMNHKNLGNYGGWAGCDLRYDILGSTDIPPYGYPDTTTSIGRVGYDASETCATSPVANTLMAALPADLRAVMKPMTKYTDNKGGNTNVEENVTATIDYLPLMARFEIDGTAQLTNSYEPKKLKPYTYYGVGNSRVKYYHSDAETAVNYWLRSPHAYGDYAFCKVQNNSFFGTTNSKIPIAIAPIFKV